MKKGQTDLLFYIFRALLILLLIFLLRIQIGFFTETHIPTGNLEAQLITDRILFGPSGIALRSEETGNPLSGTVDLARIGDRELTLIFHEGFRKSKHEDENFWGGRVSFYVSRAALDADDALHEGFIEPESIATNLLPFARAGVKGSGSANYFQRVYPVQYLSPRTKQPELGWIMIELVRRR